MDKSDAAVRKQLKATADADGALAPHAVERDRLLAQPGVLEIYDDAARGDDGLFWAWKAKETGKPIDVEELERCVLSRLARGAPVDEFAWDLLHDADGKKMGRKPTRHLPERQAAEQLAVNQLESMHNKGGRLIDIEVGESISNNSRSTCAVESIYTILAKSTKFTAATLKTLRHVYQRDHAQRMRAFYQGGQAGLRQHLWESGAADAAIVVSYLRMRLGL